MAAKIETEHAFARQDTFKVNPSDITRGINSRNPDGTAETADYKEAVKKRAVDIAINGQLQPAEVRRDENNHLILTFGFTRADAVESLRNGFTAIDPRDNQERTFHDPDATLWVKVVDCDEETAFLRGVKENREREQVTDYQEAKQHQFLRDKFGKKDADIAREYGYTNQNRVALLRGLLACPQDIQDRVKDGKLAVSVAVNDLKGISDEEKAAILSKVDTTGGKISGSEVRKAVREKLVEGITPTNVNVAEETVTATTPAPKKGKKGKNTEPPSLRRSRHELIKFFEEVTAEDTHCSAKVKAVFEAVLKYAEGRHGEKAVWNRINEI